MTNLVLKSRDITLPTKVRLVKAMVFPVVMYWCESWTVKKAEHWRIDAFELWCWSRLLRVPWTARRSTQSILKEISPGCSLEGLMLKLKLQYFGHLMRRVDSEKRLWCWEGLGAGGEGDDRGWDGWMASLTRWTWVWVNSRSWCDSWGHKELDMTERLNWTDRFFSIGQLLLSVLSWCSAGISMSEGVCICGERCTPRPSTPLPSYSPLLYPLFNWLLCWFWYWFVWIFVYFGY